jgi:hypothetical protein
MNAHRELVKVRAALEHATARERAVASEGGEHATLVAQVYVAILRARAAQLRRLIALGESASRFEGQQDDALLVELAGRA